MLTYIFKERSSLTLALFRASFKITLNCSFKEEAQRWLFADSKLTLEVFRTIPPSFKTSFNSTLRSLFTINAEELVFILYLAVNDKIRSKGYGSAILQCIKQRFSNKAIALNIEPLDPKSDNYAQRIKRFEFYLKNGFVDTHYQILATTTQFPIKEYKLTIKQLSFGLYSPQIKEHTN